jgi:hypothetical protein
MYTNTFTPYTRVRVFVLFNNFMQIHKKRKNSENELINISYKDIM